MTEYIIDSSTDENLLQVILDELLDIFKEDFSKEYETVLTWNKGKQALYIIMWLEMEINNGGFDQFYHNSSGRFYKLLPEALNLLGAKKFAELTSRANYFYENEYEQSAEDENSSLEPFDDEFYALYDSEDLAQLQVDYIRQHKAEFI